MAKERRESEFEQDYKVLRNCLRSYKRDEFLLGLIHTLRKDEGISFEEYAKGKPMPWTLLTLAKLACEFCGTNTGARKALHADFVKVYNMAYELEGTYGTLILEENFHGFFLLLCHQQFWHQREIIRSAFARLDYLFCTENAQNSFNLFFSKKYGLGIQTFAELLVATWIIWKTTKSFSCNLVYHLGRLGYGKNDITNFLANFSVDVDNIRRFVENRPSPVKNYFLQFGERTPFLLAPIIQLSDSVHVLISLRLIERSITTFLFEAVKQSGDEEIIRSFANIFEEDTRLLLVGAKLDPWCSSDLEPAFSGKSTDFLLQCGKKTVFIENKSIRLSPIAVAHPTPDVLLSDIKDSVCKAIEQCYELATELNTRCEGIDPHLIIVTYDDIFMGEPQRTWDYLFKGYFSYNGANLPITEVLSPNKIFIMGIQEFEQLCEFCDGPDWLEDLLTRAVEDNAQPGTAKHGLLMHVKPDTKRKTMPLIKKHFRGIFSRITSKLQKEVATLPVPDHIATARI